MSIMSLFVVGKQSGHLLIQPWKVEWLYKATLFKDESCLEDVLNIFSQPIISE